MSDRPSVERIVDAVIRELARQNWPKIELGRDAPPSHVDLRKMLIAAAHKA